MSPISDERKELTGMASTGTQTNSLPAAWTGDAGTRIRAGVLGGARLGVYLGTLFGFATVVTGGTDPVMNGLAIFVAALVSGGILGASMPYTHSNFGAV